MTGRTLLVGDVHGCDIALKTIVDRVGVAGNDTLVFLGDLVDRGPASREVMDQVIDLKSTCNVIVVMGNHEEMLLDALNGRGFGRWLKVGGAETVQSYGGTLAEFPQQHFELLNDSVPYWESASHIGIHANLEPGTALPEQQADWLRWQHLTGMEFPHPSGKLVVCGHSGIPGGLPAIGDGWVCLDTLAYKGGFLTCLEAETGELFQSTQLGSFRSGVCLRDLA